MQYIRQIMGRLRIKTLIYTLISVMVLCFVALQGAYLINMRSVSRENARQYLSLSLAHLTETIHAFSEHMDQLGRELAFSAAANDFIQSTNAVEWYQRLHPLLAMINSAQIADRNIQRIIYTDFNMLNIGASDHADFVLINEIGHDIKHGFLDIAAPRHIRRSNQSVYVRQSGYNKRLNRQFYLIILYSDRSFQNAIRAMDATGNQFFALYNEQGQVIVQNGVRLDMDKTLTGKQPDMREDGVRFDSGYVVAVSAVPEIGWRWVTVSPEGGVHNQFGGFAQFSLVITGTLILLLLLVAAMIQQSVTQPILYVNRFMSGINEDYDSRRLVLVQNNEIGELAGKLNDMLSKIGAMNRDMIKAQQRIYESELDRQHMELAALYSQINPHFLYNTLDCIRSIAAIHRVEPIVQMTSSMTKIFRYSIKSSTFVQVKEEMGSIAEYMRILQIRYQGIFTERYEVDEDCLTLLIPKMILQPVVENAVFHGLEQKRKGGTLTIRGWLGEAGDGLEFEISDDGKGMDEEMLSALQASLEDSVVLMDTSLRDKKSIGLRNIHARIRLLCGDAYGMSVESEADKGTRVRIKLPVMHSNLQ